MLHRKKIVTYLFEVIMIILSLIIIMPLYFAVLNSLKSPEEAALLNFALPGKLHFENYLTVFKEADILGGLKNSLIVTISSVFIEVTLSALAAFIIHRRCSRVTKAAYNYIICGLIPSGFIITTVFLVSKIGLYGTFPGLILVNVAGNAPMAVFLFTGFMNTVPREIDEAAIVDGCNLNRLFFKIIFPQLLPIIATASIIVAIGVWNDFMGPLLYLKSSKQYTLPMMVYSFNSMYNTQWELVFAVLIVICLPILLAYAFAQKYIVSGMTAGALKG